MSKLISTLFLFFAFTVQAASVSHIVEQSAGYSQGVTRGTFTATSESAYGKRVSLDGGQVVRNETGGSESSEVGSYVAKSNSQFNQSSVTGIHGNTATGTALKLETGSSKVKQNSSGSNSGWMDFTERAYSNDGGDYSASITTGGSTSAGEFTTKFKSFTEFDRSTATEFAE